MKIYNSITEMIGKTPLLKLNRLFEGASIYAKCEGLNPAGSTKDRAALSMILDAEEKGILKSGGYIIEPTSGNTGIGLAAIAAARGYKAILTMPETMSLERRKLLAAYGAEIVLTEGAKGMQGAIDKANELAKEYTNSIIAGQFYNTANPKAHYLTTGPEIWEALDGCIDIFVAGVGTGGTISGVGRFLKEKDPSIKTVAFEPEDSPLITKGYSGAHKLQGIGANFIPENFDRSVVDEMMTVSTEEAYHFARKMAKKEGLLVGITSGAALACADKLARRCENKNKNIVVLLPDDGSRYLSTDLFE